MLFVLLLSTFLTPASGSGYLGIPLTAGTTQSIDTVCPGPDACSYLTVGKELLETGSVSSDNYWILNFWPPGVAVQSATYILIARSGLALPVVAGMLSVLGWTVVLSAWHRWLYGRVGQLAAVATVVAIALSQPMRGWYLANGLFYAESTAMLFALGALLVFVRSPRINPAASEVNWHSARYGVFGGLLLAGAAYMRSPFEAAAGLFTALVVAGAVGSFALRFVRERSFRDALQSFPPRVIGIAAVIAFHAATVPWRVVAATWIRPGDLRWSLAGDLGWNHIWMPSRYLEAQGASWLVEATRNTACRVDTARCEAIYQAEIASSNPYFGGGRTVGELRNNALEAMLRNPLEWIWIKAEAFPAYWFRAPRSVDQFEFVENGLLLASLLLVLIVGWRCLPRVAYVYFFAVAATALVPPIVFHYEERYFYTIKTLTIPLIVLCLSALFMRKRDLGLDQQVQVDPGLTDACEGRSKDIAPRT